MVIGAKVDSNYKLLVNTSGDVVLISGQAVTVSGNIVQISGQGVLANVSGNLINVITRSGDYVVISGTIQTSVSGNIVQISGQGIITSISGNVVKISGETIIAKISGEVVKISGEVVRLIPGKALIDAFGLDDTVGASGVVLPSYKGSGNQILPIFSMGLNRFTNPNAPSYRGISVDNEGCQFVTTHSGEYVVVSGTIMTSMSGNVVIAKVSGEVVKISGEVVRISGSAVTVSGNDIFVITASGDYVVVSGTVFSSVSGNIVQISGQGVIFAGGFGVFTSVSGDIVQISGQSIMSSMSGNIVQISGQSVTFGTVTTVRVGATVVVTGASGGAAISSGVIVSVTVKALSTNVGDLYVGGSGAGSYPYTGFGYLLEAGEVISADVDSLLDIFLFATVSGDQATFLGVN